MRKQRADLSRLHPDSLEKQTYQWTKGDILTLSKHLAGWVFDAMSGNRRVAESVLRTSTRGRLRILAYHGVSELSQLESQLRWLKDTLIPISASDACAIVEGSIEIPGAVWVTFDDGDPSVLDLALPLLVRLGIPASLYVCPGAIVSGQPFWWQVVEEAVECGFESPTVSSLKAMTDERRREHVKVLIASLPRDIQDRGRSQLDESSLRRWLDAGNTIGNHTWDHPLLDMASEEEQIRQIRLSHDWLAELLGTPPETFAYPNGNVTIRSRMELMSLGYRVGLLFDHRIASVPATDPLTVSRLRVNSWQDMAKYRTIVSGIHPWAHHLLRRE